MNRAFLDGTTALFTTLLLVAVGNGCSRREPNQIQGYVEGEFVYVASPLGGAVQKFHCQRGTQLAAGAPLFELESGLEQATRDEAEKRVVQARATLLDAQKGRRPSEIEAIEAQLQQARLALDLSKKELAREEELIRTKVATAQEVDRAKTTNDQNSQRVTQLEAELQTARLGSRPDQVAAAEANVRATEATLAKAQWELSQKKLTAPQAGLVFDTLYREGEWVAAGRPVVVLLPPENLKVRAFVPEPRIGALRIGAPVQVRVDGLSNALTGKVSFVSPRAEYAPPVIYSRESRSKLVFMIEVVFEPATAATLHPGQPVDVQLGS